MQAQGYDPTMHHRSCLVQHSYGKFKQERNIYDDMMSVLCMSVALSGLPWSRAQPTHISFGIFLLVFLRTLRWCQLARHTCTHRNSTSFHLTQAPNAHAITHTSDWHKAKRINPSETNSITYFPLERPALLWHRGVYITGIIGLWSMILIHSVRQPVFSIHTSVVWDSCGSTSGIEGARIFYLGRSTSVFYKYQVCWCMIVDTCLYVCVAFSRMIDSRTCVSSVRFCSTGRRNEKYDINLLNCCLLSVSVSGRATSSSLVVQPGCATTVQFSM